MSKKIPDMTLVEALKGKDFVYVGSTTAFFYIGKAEDAEEYITTAEKNYLAELGVKLKQLKASHASTLVRIEKAELCLTKTKAELERLISKFSTFEFPAADEFSSNKVAVAADKIEKYKKEISSANTRKLELERSIKASSRYIENFAPFMGRKVIDIYKRQIVPPLGTIIIVKGGPGGRYWDYEEFLEDNNYGETGHPFHLPGDTRKKDEDC